jgi:hypothetical protein
MEYKTLIAALLFSVFRAFGQITPPPTPQFSTWQPLGINGMPTAPQPATLAPQVTIGFPNPHPTMPNAFGQNMSIQQQNQMLIQQSMQMEQQRQMQQQQMLAEIDADMRESEPVQYELPDQSQQEGGEIFKQSFSEISGMLEGKQDLSLKRAVFLSENATYGQLDYDWFCYLIQKETDFVKMALAAEKLTIENKDAVKWMLYRLFADTIQVGNEKHIPFTYDFEDPFGKTDWTKMYVSKLLTTRKGQCHSMPLLYLILAEELGVDAYLAYSPQHSYIKVQNSKGNWYNFETTNGNYTNDSWVLSSNFIKAESVQKGVYLDTLGKKKVIASCLNDLGQAYIHKFGSYDKFASQCAEKTLETHPNNINALKIKANYKTVLFDFVVWQMNYPPPASIHEYPEAYELLRLRDETYDKMDALGFEEMPEEAYNAWLKSFENKKGKQAIEIIRP